MIYKKSHETKSSSDGFVPDINMSKQMEYICRQELKKHLGDFNLEELKNEAIKMRQEANIVSSRLTETGMLELRIRKLEQSINNIENKIKQLEGQNGSGTASVFAISC